LCEKIFSSEDDPKFPDSSIFDGEKINSWDQLLCLDSKIKSKGKAYVAILVNKLKTLRKRFYKPSDYFKEIFNDSMFENVTGCSKSKGKLEKNLITSSFVDKVLRGLFFILLPIFSII
jgi:hypothetical protein